MELNEWEEKMEKESRKLIDDFGNLVNNMSFDPKYLINQFTREHRTLQQNMFRTILELISFMASDKYLTDGRNDGSKAMAEKLIKGYAEIMKQEEIERMKKEGCGKDYAEQKGEEYRLQILENPQSYLGLAHI